MIVGDRMIVRNLHHDFFEFTPRFKLCLSFNNRPQIRAQDEGIWRRVLLVEFPVIIPAERRDRDLVKKPWKERSGILNWRSTAFRFGRKGLRVPDAVLAATNDYRSDCDPVGQFLEAVIRTAKGAAVLARDLYTAYKLWCRQNAMEPISQTVFGWILVERGYRKAKSGMIFYRDIETADEIIVAAIRAGAARPDIED